MNSENRTSVKICSRIYGGDLWRAHWEFEEGGFIFVDFVAGAVVSASSLQMLSFSKTKLDSGVEVEVISVFSGAGELTSTGPSSTPSLGK
jgi:hypothetical protein